MLSTIKQAKKADELLFYVIWERIAVYADELSLFRLGGVAKFFRDLVDTDIVWHHRIPHGIAIAMYDGTETAGRTNTNAAADLRGGQQSRPAAATDDTSASSSTLAASRFRRPHANINWMFTSTNDADISNQLDELEEVIASLVVRSRRCESSLHNNQPSRYSLPSTFFLTNRSFVRYIAATFVAQMANGWTIFLEKELFTKPLYHPDVWWHFRRTQYNDTIPVLLCPLWEVPPHQQSLTDDNKKKYYKFIFDSKEPAKTMNECLQVDLSLDDGVPTFRKYADRRAGLVQANLETRQIVVGSSASSSTTTTTRYLRPLQALVSRCIAEAARSRLRDILVLFQCRDSLIPRIVFTAGICSLSGMLYAGAKYFGDGFTTPTEAQLKASVALLPSSLDIEQHLDPLRRANHSDFSTVPTNRAEGPRYPFLLRETPQESRGSWFSILSPSFWKKCAQHVFSFYETYPAPRDRPLSERAHRLVYHLVEHVLPVAYVLADLGTVIAWGVGDVTNKIGDEYPNQSLMPSFWKRMMIQIPFDFVAVALGFVASRYSGLVGAFVFGLPVVLGYRMSWRVFWFLTDYVVVGLVNSSNNSLVNSSTINTSRIPFSSLNWLSVVGSDFDPENLEIGFYLLHACVQLVISSRMFAIDHIGVENYVRIILMEVFTAAWHPVVDRQIVRQGWTKHFFNVTQSVKAKEKGGLRAMIDGCLLSSGMYLVRYTVQEIYRKFLQWRHQRDSLRKKKQD